MSDCSNHDIETAIHEAIKTYETFSYVPAPLDDAKDIRPNIDHTLLRPEATPQEVVRLCQEAMEHRLFAVCVASSYAKLAREVLRGSSVRLACVVGFPHGHALTRAKLREARLLERSGCDEIDTVIHLGALRAGEYRYILREWKNLKKVFAKTVKVIVETGVLTKDEKIASCTIARLSGVDFVKTCTGFLPGQATVEDIALMKAIVGPGMQVKASGGIRDRAMALSLLAAGASRLGCSASLNLLADHEKQGL